MLTPSRPSTILVDTGTDILAADGDEGPCVIVSSDDTWLSASGGVSRAILRAAGPTVAQEMRTAVREAGGELVLGSTLATSGGATGANAILHAVTLDWMRRRAATHGLLEALLLRLLDHAAALGARSLRLPLLGTGTAGVSQDAFQEALEVALREHFSAPSPLRRLRLVSLAPHVPMPALPAGRPPSDLARLAGSRSSAARTHVEEAARIGLHPDALAPLERAVRAGIGALDPEVASRTADPRAGDALARLDEAVDSSGPGWFARWRDLYRIVASDLCAAEPSGSPIELASVGALSTGAGLTAGTVALRLVHGVAELVRERKPHEPRPTQVVAQRAVGPAPPPLQPAGRTPPERLANLLLQTLSPEARAHHVAVLDRQGYRGGDVERFAEHVLRAGPRNVLRAYTDAFTRARLARERAGLTDPDPDDDLATDTLVTWCGFRIAPPPKGLSTFRAEISRLQRLAETEPASSDDRVVTAGRLLEALLKQLLRFHLHAHWGRPPDEVATDLGLWKGELRLLGLGALFDAGYGLCKRLRREPPDEAGQSFRALYGARGLLPKGAKGLATLRNAFTHDGRPILATDAPRFFADASVLLDHLGTGSPPVFPSVVSVRGRREDENGTLWEARDDAGLDERIHTDLPLEIGRTYFMVPRSNPVRVFPVLVEA